MADGSRCSGIFCITHNGDNGDGDDGDGEGNDGDGGRDRRSGSW
jgi:hypothetical protein